MAWCLLYLRKGNSLWGILQKHRIEIFQTACMPTKKIQQTKINKQIKPIISQYLI